MKTFWKRWNTLTARQKYIVYGALGGIVIVLGAVGFAAYSATRPTVTEEKTTITSDGEIIEGGELPVSEEKIANASPLTGQQCDNYAQRPIAVMMAGDVVARPLSGLSQADIVVEMPVITGSVTRLMGVFLCNLPQEVGSVRSARHDYISLVRGWDAIYVHWGGSHFALDELKTGKRYTGEDLGKISDIDALSSSGPFFRKSTVPAPHNGFVSLPKILDTAKSRNYSLTTTLEGYKFQSTNMVNTEKANAQNGVLYVGFATAYATKWEYSKDTNSYTRYWYGKKDADRGNNNIDVTPKNIIVLRASSRQIEGQYNEVSIYGKGEGKIYHNGKEKSITWKKDGFKDMLRFYDEAGKEVALVPGQSFIQVIEPGQSLAWELN